jgi:hypothetical protein
MLLLLETALLAYDLLDDGDETNASTCICVREVCERISS